VIFRKKAATIFFPTFLSLHALRFLVIAGIPEVRGNPINEMPNAKILAPDYFGHLYF
jgi:hypothetical protein